MYIVADQTYSCIKRWFPGLSLSIKVIGECYLWVGLDALVFFWPKKVSVAVQIWRNKQKVGFEQKWFCFDQRFASKGWWCLEPDVANWHLGRDSSWSVAGFNRPSQPITWALIDSWSDVRPVAGYLIGANPTIFMLVLHPLLPFSSTYQDFLLH